MENCPELWQDWKTVKMIGQSRFGQVYEIERTLFGDKEYAAIKKISIPSGADETASLIGRSCEHERLASACKDQLNRIVDEYKLMKKLSGHTNIVNCDELRFFPHDDGIGWDILIKTELLTPLTEMCEEDFDEAEVQKLGVDICQALVLCEKNGAFHGSIKPSNILFSPSGSYKLGDLGIARVMGQFTETKQSPRDEYTAPELTNGCSYSIQADIYSLGILMSRLPGSRSEGMQKIIQKACAANLAKRWSCAEDMLRALTELEKKPVGQNGEPGNEKEAGKKNPLFRPVYGAAIVLLSVVWLAFSRLSVSRRSAVPPTMPVTNLVIAPQSQSVSEKNLMCAQELNRKNPDKWNLQPVWGQSSIRREDVKAIRFCSSLSGAPADAWDVSADRNASVMSWMNGDELVIAADGNIVQEDGYGLFGGFTGLERIDFGGCFDTSYMTDMSFMFYKCRALEELDLSTFNTAGVTEMRRMFSQSDALRSLDISFFSGENLISAESMFSGCAHLLELKLGGFSTPHVTDMSRMFFGCIRLSSLDTSGLDTSSVIDGSEMFCSCKELSRLDVGRFNTSSMQDMSEMFSGCSSLKSLDLSGFTTREVRNMKDMFKDCSSLEELDIRTFFTENVTDMSSMFEGCTSLSGLNMAGLTVSSLRDSSCMFKDCKNLSTLELTLQGFSLVTTTAGMFSGCSSLTSLDVSSLNTSSVRNMSDMFSGCSSLRTMVLSRFNTGSATDMSNMFAGCSSLTRLDVRSFNTSNVTNMSGMFDNCRALADVDLSGFDTAKVTNVSRMFRACVSLPDECYENLFIDNVTEYTDYLDEGRTIKHIDWESMIISHIINHEQAS